MIKADTCCTIYDDYFYGSKTFKDKEAAIKWAISRSKEVSGTVSVSTMEWAVVASAGVIFRDGVPYNDY